MKLDKKWLEKTILEFLKDAMLSSNSSIWMEKENVEEDTQFIQDWVEHHFENSEISNCNGPRKAQKQKDNPR